MTDADPVGIRVLRADNEVISTSAGHGGQTFPGLSAGRALGVIRLKWGKLPQVWIVQMSE